MEPTNQNQSNKGQNGNLNTILIVLFLLLILCLGIGVFYYFILSKNGANTSTTSINSQNNTTTTKTGPTSTPIPTPTKVPLSQVSPTYYFGGLNMKITISQVSFNTVDPKNEKQTVVVKASDIAGSINSVSATVVTDKLSKTYPLNLVSGTGSEGVWSGNWILSDTYNDIFKVTFAAKDNSKNSTTVTAQIR